MTYSHPRGPWKDIPFRSQYDYRKFHANPALHPYWERMPQLKRWALQYEQLHDMTPEESMRRGSEYRHHLDRMLVETQKGR